MPPASPSAVPNPDDQFCPICKTTRYLRKDLAFLINPECYHPMCTVCVARIFADGPAPCPHALCTKTLRRAKFRVPRFADLAVEREVDIRRRVAGVFNKQQHDFDDLVAFNEYLDTVESLTMDLVYGEPAAAEKAERELSEWEAQHRQDIERRRKQSRDADAARKRSEAADLEAQRLRRLDAARQDADEKRHAARLREEMLDGLTSAESGRAAAAGVVKKITLKKRQTRTTGADTAVKILTESNGGPSLMIRGLRQDAVPSHRARDNAPYDPFGGLDLTPSRYTLEPGDYHSRWVDQARSAPEWRSGGYSADEYLGRVMLEAFGGLAVFVAEEKEGRV